MLAGPWLAGNAKAVGLLAMRLILRISTLLLTECSLIRVLRLMLLAVSMCRPGCPVTCLSVLVAQSGVTTILMNRPPRLVKRLISLKGILWP